MNDPKDIDTTTDDGSVTVVIEPEGPNDLAELQDHFDGISWDEPSTPAETAAHSKMMEETANDE